MSLERKPNNVHRASNHVHHSTVDAVSLPLHHGMV